MAENNLNAADALRAKVFKILTGEKTPPAAFLSYAPGGLPQSDFTLRFLKEAKYTTEAFTFERLADSVPLGVGDWVESTTNLSEIYTNWLDQYEPPPFSLTPEEQKKLDDAEKFILNNYDNYVQYQGEFQNTYVSWYTLVVMPEADRPPDYGTKLALAKNKMDAADKAWNIKGQRGKYDTNYAIVQDLSQRDPTRTKEMLRTKLGQPLTSPLGEYYPTRIMPTNLLDTGFEWPKFSFYHNEVHEYEQNDSYRWGGSASYGALLWSASAEHEGQKKYAEHKTDISNMKIEFELLRAPIIRPWFSTFLLRGRGWKWRNSTKEDPTGGNPFSDGKIPPEQGNLPMIPTEAIFARNLTVKLDMSSTANKESLLATQSKAEAGWGLFKIKGSVETSNGTKSYDFVEEADGITCNQPQIIGFFSELMPMTPNPNWALWDKKLTAAGSGSE